MIKNRYGNLTVISFDEATQIAIVRCGCGNTETMRHYRLIRIGHCDQCEDRKKYINSLKVDMSLLKNLSVETSARLLGAYAQHIEVSHKNNIRATKWETFAREKLADPDFLNNQSEPDQSFEARLIRSNPQKYHQYA